jgi:hypothetical protein
MGIASVLAAYLLATPSIWSLGNRSEEMALSAADHLIDASRWPDRHAIDALTGDTRGQLAWFCDLFCRLDVVSVGGVDPAWKNDDELMASGFTVLGFGSLAVASLVGPGRPSESVHQRVGLAIVATGDYSVW